MNEPTARALAAINRAFYEGHAHAFSDTRRSPWKGWQRLRPRLAALAAEGRPLRVLDLGCGNGRFARFVAEALPEGAPRTEGVDASEALLEQARRDAPPGARFHRLDFLRAPRSLPPGPFELVALFGVLHGVPGRAERRRLLAACARRVAAGGLLVFTVWRLAADPRLAGRVLDWERYNARAAEPIDPRELEPGDLLLPWGEGEDAVRYVHAFDESELAERLRELPLTLEARYLADGRSGAQNEYLVLRAP